MKNQMIKYIAFAASIQALVLTSGAETTEERFTRLEQEIATLRGERSDMAILEEKISKARFGGYGEIHAGFEENGKDQFDIHRLVFYVGYDFADWIKLTSETEIEHAFVSDGDGEISVEQLYVDFLLSDAFNVRAGRVLAPLGIINQHHEPVLFNGVERPNVDKNIIPSTWSLDGIGIFGFPMSWVSYEAYLVAGLDGSQFRAKDGVRKGRIKERGDLGDPAITGRIDFYPITEAKHQLRMGISGYHGGTDNVDEGGGNGIDNTFSLYSADFEYEVSRLQFRGVVAQGHHSDAEDLPAGTGEEIFGWYLEAGAKVLPESWKKGKLEEAELIPFVRYEEYDTQHKLPNGAVASGAYDRTEITVGANLLLTRQLVVKADYQFMRNEMAGDDANNKFNLGLGWVFQ